MPEQVFAPRAQRVAGPACGRAKSPVAEFEEAEPIVEIPKHNDSFVVQMYGYEREALGAFSREDYDLASSLFKIAGELAQKAKISGEMSWRNTDYFGWRMLNLEFSCYRKMAEKSNQAQSATPALSEAQFNRAIEVLRRLDDEGEIPSFTHFVLEIPKRNVPFATQMHEHELRARDALSREDYASAASLFETAIRLAQEAKKYEQMPWHDADYAISRMLDLEFSCYCRIIEKSYEGGTSNPVLSGGRVRRAIEVLELLGGEDKVLHFIRLVHQSCHMRMERMGKDGRTGNILDSGPDAALRQGVPEQQPADSFAVA